MLGETNPYATLEVEPSATSDEIDQAYRRLRALLEDDQLAAYGMLTPDELAAQRNELEAAYQVLHDPERRRAYDERARPELGASLSAPGLQAASVRNAPRAAPRRPGNLAPTGNGWGRARFATIDPNAVELAPDAAYDGPKLRRLREYAGASLDDLSERTKISRRYLKAIEADDYGLLPAKVYVRGFVTAYARVLGLEGRRVAESYVNKMAGASGRS